MGKAEKISIIIPTYNRKGLLHDALVELLGADEPNFECIIVDDASTDGMGEEVEGWRQRWGADRIVYLQQKENQGAQVARNWGIAESKGDFLLFMDSDDLPCPEGIRSLHAHLELHPELDYCFGRVLKTDAELDPLRPTEEVGSPFDGSPLEIAGYHWHTMGALYRRECAERVGLWNTELTGSQDWEYQARVKISGAKGEFLNTLVGYWRQHDGDRVGTSKFRPDYVRSVMLACKSILETADTVGKRDRGLETRLAKRLAVHALEWGVHGYSKERRECFEQARETLSRQGKLSCVLRIWSILPTFLDPLLFNRLSRA